MIWFRPSQESLLSPSSRGQSPPKPTKHRPEKGVLNKNNKVKSKKDVRYSKHQQSWTEDESDTIKSTEYHKNKKSKELPSTSRDNHQSVAEYSRSKRKIVQQIRSKLDKSIEKPSTQKKNRIEILNTYSKSISGQQRPNRDKSPIVTVKPSKLPDKMKFSNPDQYQEKEPLRISIRDKNKVKHYSDEETELEIEIIEKNKSKANAQKDNLITVDLTGFNSPQKIPANSELPVLNISLDQTTKKGKIEQDKRVNQYNNDNFKQRDSSKKTLKTFQEKPVYDFGTIENYESNLAKDRENDTAEFAKDNPQNLNTIDLYYPNNISQNLIKQRYRPPNNHQHIDNSKLLNANQSSGNVVFEWTIEDKLRQTNDLINDAINTLEQAHSSQVIDEARIHILKSEKDRLKKITEFVSPLQKRTETIPPYNSMVNEALAFEEESPNFAWDQSSLNTKDSKKELGSPLKNQYQEMLNKSREEQKENVKKQRSRSSGRKHKSRKTESENKKFIDSK